MKTILYVDGFNLYYGAVKGTPFKWLNILKMAQLLLPGHDIIGIKYFTALVSSRPDDPNKTVRQQMYLRALRTLPGVEMIFGHFLSHPVRMRLANPPPTGPSFALVWKTEEKGSDVNLATHLLTDAFRCRIESAVIVSNDSDLVEPIRVVTEELGKKVGILNPQRHPSKMLARHATFFKPIRTGVLRASQFADTLEDSVGLIVKPIDWH